jgi:hypothetical protein
LAEKPQDPRWNVLDVDADPVPALPGQVASDAEEAQVPRRLTQKLWKFFKMIRVDSKAPGEKWSYFENDMPGLHPINPLKLLPPKLHVVQQYLSQGIRVNDRERASILRGRSEGVGAVKTILDQAIPGFAPDKRLKFANQIVDALLDKSVSARLSRKAAQSAGSSSTGSRQAQCGLARSLAEPLAAGAGWRFRHHSLRFDFQRTAVTDWPVFAYSAAEAFAYLINRRTSAPDLGKHSGDGRDP